MLVRGSFVRSVSLRNNGPHVFFCLTVGKSEVVVNVERMEIPRAVDHVVNKLD